MTERLTQAVETVFVDACVAALNAGYDGDTEMVAKWRDVARCLETMYPKIVRARLAVVGL